MRVTNSMLINQFLYNMNNNLDKMQKHDYQLATGKKIFRPSDDPVGITRSLQARTDLSKLERYIQNVSDAKAWLTQSETSLMEMNEIIKRAYDLAVDGANSTKTLEDRQASAKELRELEEHLVQAANTTFGGRYIFGGYNTVKDPFELSEDGALLYNGIDIKSENAEDIEKLGEYIGESIQFEIGPNTNMQVSINGLELLGVGEGNVFDVINGLTNALETGDTDIIDESVGTLQKAQENILSHIADVGGKYNRLEMVEYRYKDDYINYTGVKSEVEDVDQAEATMQLKMAEMVYRSSLAVGARIIQPTLVDFLR